MEAEIRTTYLLADTDSISVCAHADGDISITCGVFDGFVIYMKPEKAGDIISRLSHALNELRTRNKGINFDVD